jgi:two-component system OmpR family sensor kinase
VTSVRWTAYRWIVSVLAVIAVISTAVSYIAGKDEANHVFDGQLAQIALHVGSDTRALPPGAPKLDPEDELIVQIWDGEGRPVRATGGVDIPRQDRAGFADLRVGDIAWRVFTLEDKGQTIQVAQRQKVRDTLAEHLALAAALPLLAAIPLAWGFFVVGLGRLFRRLDLASTDLAYRSGDPTALLPLDIAPGEVRPLIVAMNELLQQQRAAGAQQRQFVSDAAHELRTPLAAIQILVDTLAERSSTPGASVTDIVGDLSLATGRARALCNQLLKLAELDARKDRTPSTEIDLHRLLLEVVAGHVQFASRKGIELSLSVTTELRVKAEKTDLTSLFSNLVDNAIRYGDAGIVEISMRMQDGSGLVEVVNGGSGIPAEALPRIFDRFFRAALQEIEGTGLGLAIAKATADRYRFTLSVANRPAGGVIASVAIPADALLINV